MAKFEKGKSGNPKGRTKGSKNKFTSLKDSFLEVYQMLGGTEGLCEWAEDSKANKKTFYQMICRMLPTNVSGEVSGDLKVIIERMITEERPKE